MWPSVATTSQSHFRVPNSLIIWVKQQEDNSEIEVPTQKQLLAPYYDELERVIHEMTSEDRLGNAWITSNKYKGSGNYLLPKTCVEIPDDQYKALLNLRLMMFPEVDGGLYQPTDLRQIIINVNIVTIHLQTQIVKAINILTWEKMMKLT